MKNKIALSSLLFSIISLIISGCSAFHYDKISIDWLGVLVGILSLLVTALLAFQIWNLVWLDDKIKSIVEAQLQKHDDKFKKYIKDEFEDFDHYIGSVAMHTKGNYLKGKEAIPFLFSALCNASKSRRATKSIAHILNDIHFTLLETENMKDSEIDCCIKTLDNINLDIDTDIKAAETIYQIHKTLNNMKEGVKNTSKPSHTKEFDYTTEQSIKVGNDISGSQNTISSSINNSQKQ